MGKNGETSLRMMLADLHIHTCLSPCATLDMTPQKIVKEAYRKRLDLIAITDHNSAENVGAVVAAARHTGLAVIPGIEVTTSEEVHIVGLFQDTEDALAMQSLVYDRLQTGENDDDLFGMQVVANEFDEVEGMNRRLLIGATRLDLGQVVDAIHNLHGLAVAAHIDREAFSIVGQLGFIPEDLDLDAVEISKKMHLKQGRIVFSHLERFAFITSSDAHDLDDIGTSPTAFQMAGPELAELRYALKGTGGRKIECKISRFTY
ncbi:MAG: PHP domain-containing protein [Deltaproteobacteria bacterium]|nr:PHP domain-containing protein [Deltaproteobacteria bacterium]